MTLNTPTIAFLTQLGLNPEQLAEFIKLQSAESIKGKEWLTPDELEIEPGISKSTQAKYRMARKIPFSKIGGRYIRYSRTEIDKWLRSNQVEVA